MTNLNDLLLYRGHVFCIKPCIIGRLYFHYFPRHSHEILAGYYIIGSIYFAGSIHGSIVSSCIAMKYPMKSPLTSGLSMLNSSFK